MWIARGNNPDPWEYFYPEPEGNSNPTQIEEIIVDPLERVWAASPSTVNGAAYVLEDRGSFADSSVH